MTKGPFRAAIQEGALALEHGWDPLAYLGLGHEERLIGKEILQAAIDRKAERDNHFWKNAAAAVQNGIVRAFKA